jgi:Flp pilus assembly protein TadD
LAVTGIAHRKAGRSDEAVTALEQALRLMPRQPAYLNELGIAQREAGRFDAARQAFEAAVAADPSDPALLLNLGMLHDLYLGDAARALDAYSRALALMPGGDATVSKWLAELKTRKPATATAAPKEKA